MTGVSAGMPDGVRPQLSPIGAIMGQIMIMGMYRQAGPEGGELVALSPNGTFAEVQPGDGEPKLKVWEAVDRRDPKTWKLLPHTDLHWRIGEDRPWMEADLRVDGKAVRLLRRTAIERDMDLRTIADFVVRPQLLRIAGVSQILTVGGGRKQYQVRVDPVELQHFDLTLEMVEVALRANNVSFTGGIATQGGVEKPIRIIGRLGPRTEDVLKDLRKIAVHPGKQRPILLEQIAEVVEAPEFKRGDASVMGFPGIGITVTKQPGVDSRAVSEAVQTRFEELAATLPADIVCESKLYQLRDFIDRGVSNVAESLAIGAFLVLIVLFLFLLNVRTTMISLTAIPLSLAVTVLVFRAIGWLTGAELSIDIMTLGGIAVAMGELVDDAIVDVENIYRRLRENRALAEPRPTLDVVYEASAEVRSAIVFGTGVVILVFLPLFALSGIEGRLFAPLGIAYITSILASLLVSLTVTPVLSYYLLGRKGAMKEDRDGMLVRGLKWFAGRVVRFSMRRATLLSILGWIAAGWAGWRITTIGSEFLPPFDEGTIQVNMTLPAGASVDASVQMTSIADVVYRKHLKTEANPDGEILSFMRRTGRSEQDEHADPPNENDSFVTINPDCGKTRTETIRTIRDDLVASMPGVDIEVEQPLAHLISHLVSGSTAQIAIRVYGEDLDQLERTAKAIRGAIADVPGVSSLAVEPIRRVDEIHIRLRAEDLAYHGVDRAYVGKFLQTALHGETVSRIVQGDRRFDLVVRLIEETRTDYAALGELRIDLPNRRGTIRLKDVADVTSPAGGDSGANQIKRDNARRRLVVRCNALGRDLGSVVGDIRTAVARKVVVPENYRIEYGGQFESQQRATERIASLAAVAAVGMFFVLLQLFPSVRIVLQILNAIPTAFVGGVLALVITGQVLSVAALVGFISLGGIAVRNGILLMSHYRHLREKEGMPFGDDLVVRGSLERLSPVLMTALTAGLGLVPLVVAGQQPGREILYPVATVILGGLVTSTMCEFLIHPGIYRRFSGSGRSESNTA